MVIDHAKCRDTETAGTVLFGYHWQHLLNSEKCVFSFCPKLAFGEKNKRDGVIVFSWKMCDQCDNTPLVETVVQRNKWHNSICDTKRLYVPLFEQLCCFAHSMQEPDADNFLVENAINRRKVWCLQKKGSGVLGILAGFSWYWMLVPSMETNEDGPVWDKLEQKDSKHTLCHFCDKCDKMNELETRLLISILAALPFLPYVKLAIHYVVIHCSPITNKFLCVWGGGMLFKLIFTCSAFLLPAVLSWQGVGVVVNSNSSGTYLQWPQQLVQWLI